MNERIEIDGKVYRRVALTSVQEAINPTGAMGVVTMDYFLAYVPEDRFGTESNSVVLKADKLAKENRGLREIITTETGRDDSEINEALGATR